MSGAPKGPPSGGPPGGGPPGGGPPGGGFPGPPPGPAATPVLPGLWQVSFGFVSAYLLADGDASDAPLALIDTGVPGSAPRILGAVAELGRRPEDVRWIVATHLHVDHTGSLAELKRAAGAEVMMHPEDAALVAGGRGARHMNPAPTEESRAFVAQMNASERRMEPCATDRPLADGDELPFAGGVRVVHAPGHAAGQVALLWPRHGGVLVAADALGNRGGRLGWSVGYEDLALGVASIGRLAALEFDAAVFGHGEPMVGGAGGTFREAVDAVFRAG